MAKFFYFSSAIFALCALAVFALPHIVPRSLLRAELESALSHMTGREVRIIGSVEMSVLPTPYLLARRIRMAGDRSAMQIGPFLQLDEVEAGIDPLGLLRGKVNFSVLRLVRPVLAVERYQDDFLDALWTGKGIANQFVRFSSILIEDGVVKYLDLRHGHEVVLSQINGTMSAERLSGPFRVKAHFIHQEKRYETDFFVGRLTKRRDIDVRLALRARDRPRSLSLTGVVSRTSGFAEFPNFRGKIIAETDELHRFVDLPKDMKIFDARARLAADADIAGARIKLSNFLFETENLMLEGKAQMDFSEASRSARFSLHSPYIDPAYISGSISGQAPRDFIHHMDSLAGYARARFLALDFSIRADDLIYEKNKIRDVAFDLKIHPDDMAIRAQAVLPGSSDLRLNFKRGINDEAFAGALTIRSNDFLAWSLWSLEEGWTGIIQKLEQQFGRDFSLNANAELSRAGMRLSAIKARLGALSIRGAQWQGGVADLSFSLDHLRIADGAQFADVMEIFAQKEILPPLRLKARFDVKRVIWRDQVFNNLTIAARTQDSQLKMDKFRLESLSGDKISGAGFFDWAKSRMRLTGHIDNIKDGRRGNSAFFLEGRRIGRDGVIDVKARLSHPDAGILVKRLELWSPWRMPASLIGSGAGRAALRIQGKAGERIKIAAALIFADMGYAISGWSKNWPEKIKINIKARGQNIARLAEALPFDDVISAAGPDYAQPFTLKAHLSYDSKNGADVSGLILKTRKGDLAGKFSWARGRARARGGARAGNLWRVRADLQSDRLPVALFASEPMGKDWRSWSLPRILFGKVKGRIKIAAGYMQLGGFALNDVDLDADFLGDGLDVKNFNAQLAGGKISSAVKISQYFSNPKLSADFSVRGMDLSRLMRLVLDRRVVSGIFNASGRVKASGADLSSWISSLNGKGKISTKSGSFHGFDVALLNAALPQLSALSHLEVTLGYIFDHGQTNFGKISGSYIIKDGVMTARRLPLIAPSVRGTADMQIDFVRHSMQAEFRFTLPSRAAYPALRYIISGPWKNPRKRFNTIGLEQAFSHDLIMTGINKIKTDEETAQALPIELLDLLEYAHMR